MKYYSYSWDDDHQISQWNKSHLKYSNDMYCNNKNKISETDCHKSPIKYNCLNYFQLHNSLKIWKNIHAHSKVKSKNIKTRIHDTLKGKWMEEIRSKKVLKQLKRIKHFVNLLINQALEIENRTTFHSNPKPERKKKCVKATPCTLNSVLPWAYCTINRQLDHLGK